MSDMNQFQNCFSRLNNMLLHKLKFKIIGNYKSLLPMTKKYKLLFFKYFFLFKAIDFMSKHLVNC